MPSIFVINKHNMCSHQRTGNALSENWQTGCCTREKKKSQYWNSRGFCRKCASDCCCRQTAGRRRVKSTRIRRTQPGKKERKYHWLQKKTSDIDQTDAKKKTSLRCKASGNIDRCTTSKRKVLFNQIRITRVVVTTPTRRQRRYLYFFKKNVVGCQHVPWQSKRANHHLWRWRNPNWYDQKILDAMRSRPISCFDFLSQLDRMTGVPVHNKMSVPVSSLTRWARAVKMN